MASIKWKYLRNVLLSIGDGRHYPIPCRIVAMPINAPFLQPMPGSQKNIAPAFRSYDEVVGQAVAPMPVFEMDHVNETTFDNIDPAVPDRTKHPEWTDGFFAKIEEQAFVTAIEARAKMAGILQLIAHHVKAGNIEIISDDANLLTDDYLTLSNAEKSLAGIKVVERVDPTVVNVADLVAEGKALANVTKVTK